MPLIKSISGIRGTIGGKYGKNLTPQDIVECSAAFGAWVINRKGGKSKIVVGRDARMSGEMVNALVTATLVSLGIDVIDLGLSTTPTVEIAVEEEKADAGIIITASHNPKEWNALKLLNEKGEFISEQNGTEVLEFIENGGIHYAEVDKLGSIRKDDSYILKHIHKILALALVDVEAVKDDRKCRQHGQHFLISRPGTVIQQCRDIDGLVHLPHNLLAIFRKLRRVR